MADEYKKLLPDEIFQETPIEIIKEAQAEAIKLYGEKDTLGRACWLQAYFKGWQARGEHDAGEVASKGFDSVEDVLAENGKLNEVSMQYLRELAEAKRRVEEAIVELENANRELTVPAAEYVPAIPASWANINNALRLLRQALSNNKGGE